VASHVDGHRSGSNDQELLRAEKAATGTAPLNLSNRRG
jgi:hypothetical protein